MSLLTQHITIHTFSKRLSQVMKCGVSYVIPSVNDESSIVKLLSSPRAQNSSMSLEKKGDFKFL